MVARHGQLRAAPSMSAPVVGYVAPGDVLSAGTALGNGQWLEVSRGGLRAFAGAVLFATPPRAGTGPDLDGILSGVQVLRPGAP